MSHKKLILINEYQLCKLLNISIATAKIKTLCVDSTYIRPQLHCIIYGALGSGKSNILYEVGEVLKTSPIIDFSRATLFGTIDKNTGMLNTPAIWQCRNSCLLIDEFTFIANSPHSVNMLQGLLPILENPRFIKKVGLRVNDVSEKDKDLFLRVKDGTIDCKTRFVMIIDTMMDLRSRTSQWIDALVSRCLVIPHYPSLDDLKNLVRGGTFYEFKNYSVDSDIKISKKNYNKIIEIVEANVKKPQAYLRSVGDCCRVFAVLKKHDENIYKLIVRMKEQLL